MVRHKLSQDQVTSVMLQFDVTGSLQLVLCHHEWNALQKIESLSQSYLQTCLLQRYRWWRFVRSQEIVFSSDRTLKLFTYYLDQRIKLSSGHTDVGTPVVYGEGEDGQILHWYWWLIIQQRYNRITTIKFRQKTEKWTPANIFLRRE